MVRLFQTRRSSDVAQKQKIKEAAGILADVLVKHLGPQTFSKLHTRTMGCLASDFSSDDKLSLFAYYTTMLSTTTVLLVDGKRKCCVLILRMILKIYTRATVAEGASYCPPCCVRTSWRP